MKEKFDKIKYNMEYNKMNYKKFCCNIKKAMEYINKLLKEKNMNKADFVRWATVKKYSELYSKIRFNNKKVE